MKENDYTRVFREKTEDMQEIENRENKEYREKIKQNKLEIKKQKEKRYIVTFFIQSAICIAIIGSILIAKYVSPNTFVSVSSVLDGLYENNITLADLNSLIDENILKNNALAAFFNIDDSDNNTNGSE